MKPRDTEAPCQLSNSTEYIQTALLSFLENQKILSFQTEEPELPQREQVLKGKNWENTCSVSSPSNQIVTWPLIHELPAFLTAPQQTRSVQKLQQFSTLVFLMKPDVLVLDGLDLALF